jgi:putative ABC transport system permease protein
LTRVDPGFSPRQVLTSRISLPAGRYQSADAAARVFEDVLAAFRRVPGVEYVGAVTSLPLGGWLFGTTFALHGEAPPEPPPSAHIQHVSDGYFEALGISLTAGRSFGSGDTAEAALATIVNETFVKRFGGEGSVIGRQLRLGISTPRGSAALWEIVGVIRDVKTGRLSDADLATPEIYVPHQQSPMASMFIAVRAASGNASRLVPELRAALRAVDPELPLGAVLTMDERLGGSGCGNASGR